MFASLHPPAAAAAAAATTTTTTPGSQPRADASDMLPCCSITPRPHRAHRVTTLGPLATAPLPQL